jgi:hypothetical protein
VAVGIVTGVHGVHHGVDIVDLLAGVNVGGHKQTRAHADVGRADRKRDRGSDTIESFSAELRVGVQRLAGRRLEVFSVIFDCAAAFAIGKRLSRSVCGHSGSARC